MRRYGGFLLHLTIDLAIAIACLFGLAIALFNFAHAIDLPDFWGEMLSDAKEAPFSARGSVMNVMFLSTLVPTFLHLYFAAFALAAVRPPYRGRFTCWVEGGKSTHKGGSRAVVSAYLTFWMVIASIVLWAAVVIVLRALDWLWLRLGWGLESDPYPFWASVFRAAEAFVIF